MEIAVGNIAARVQRSHRTEEEGSEMIESNNSTSPTNPYDFVDANEGMNVHSEIHPYPLIIIQGFTADNCHKQKASIVLMLTVFSYGRDGVRGIVEGLFDTFDCSLWLFVVIGLVFVLLIRIQRQR